MQNPVLKRRSTDAASDAMPANEPGSDVSSGSECSSEFKRLLQLLAAQHVPSLSQVHLGADARTFLAIQVAAKVQDMTKLRSELGSNNPAADIPKDNCSKQ